MNTTSVDITIIKNSNCTVMVAGDMPSCGLWLCTKGCDAADVYQVVRRLDAAEDYFEVVERCFHDAIIVEICSNTAKVIL